MNTRLSSVAALIALAGITHATPGEPPSRLIDSPLSAGNLLDTGVGLMIVLAIMLGLAWLVKRYVQVPGIGKGQVQIHGGVSLGAREKAVLLSVEGRRLLVGVAPGRVQTLLVLDDTANPRPAFAEQLEVASGAAAAGHPGERE